MPGRRLEGKGSKVHSDENEIWRFLKKEESNEYFDNRTECPIKFYQG